MPELKPARRARASTSTTWTSRRAWRRSCPGFQTPIYGYDGIYPGPTIRARKGRTAIVRQKNRLAFDSNVHLHGGYVPAAHDGHPMDVILPGKRLRLHVPERPGRGVPLVPRPRARPHGADALLRPRRARTCSRDEREEELELPTGEYDIPLVLADHAFNRDGSFRYAENVDLGFRGDTILVNGAVSPRMAVERRIYRLRFLNASNARSYDLKLGNGRTMLQIASDGGLLERPVSRSTIAHPPGRAHRASWSTSAASGRGSEIVLQNARRRVGRHEERHALRRRPAAAAARSSRIPRGRMRTLEKLPAPNASRRWDLSLVNASGVQWQIAERGFDPARIDVRPRLGTTELWQWHNPSNRVHPMHLHGMLFRIVERSHRRHPPGRPRLEGHDRRAAGRDRDGPAVVHARTPAATCSTATRSSTATRR